MFRAEKNEIPIEIIKLIQSSFLRKDEFIKDNKELKDFILGNKANTLLLQENLRALLFEEKNIFMLRNPFGLNSYTFAGINKYLKAHQDVRDHSDWLGVFTALQRIPLEQRQCLTPVEVLALTANKEILKSTEIKEFVSTVKHKFKYDDTESSDEEIESSSDETESSSDERSCSSSDESNGSSSESESGCDEAESSSREDRALKNEQSKGRDNFLKYSLLSNDRHFFRKVYKSIYPYNNEHPYNREIRKEKMGKRVHKRSDDRKYILSNINFNQHNLEGMNLQEVTFNNCQFNQANLKNINGCKTQFDHSSIRETNFFGSNLRGTFFKHYDNELLPPSAIDLTKELSIEEKINYAVFGLLEKQNDPCPHIQIMVAQFLFMLEQAESEFQKAVIIYAALRLVKPASEESPFLRENEKFSDEKVDKFRQAILKKMGFNDVNQTLVLFNEYFLKVTHRDIQAVTNLKSKCIEPITQAIQNEVSFGFGRGFSGQTIQKRSRPGELASKSQLVFKQSPRFESLTASMLPELSKMVTEIKDFELKFDIQKEKRKQVFGNK